MRKYLKINKVGVLEISKVSGKISAVINIKISFIKIFNNTIGVFTNNSRGIFLF